MLAGGGANHSSVELLQVLLMRKILNINLYIVIGEASNHLYEGTVVLIKLSLHSSADFNQGCCYKH